MQFNKSLRSIGVFIVLLVVIVALSGCGGTVSDETKITGVIDGYCQALNDQDWDAARGYCVYDSIAYHEVYDFEEFWSFENPGELEEWDMNFIAESISAITITGEYAETSVYITLNVTYNGENVQTASFEGSIFLQKISNDWKLYGNYMIFG